ncbi:MAG: acyltransferase [Terracidiphilus sp.]
MQVEFDKRDTAALKGIAIAAIVFHNYFHPISRAHQNEFTFDPSRFWAFLATVKDPSLAIQAVFSFWGHFGVQIFIFLSAYGLAKSHWDDGSSWAEFMLSRVRKLYPIFGLAMLSWIALVSVDAGLVSILRQRGLEFILMLAGLSNILPGYKLPPVGPWWFIPFIIQFYAIWPLMRRFTMKFGGRGLLVLALLAVIATYLVNPPLERWQIDLLETPIGRMPVLCLGIAAARFPIRLNVWSAFPALVVLVLGSAYRGLWLFTFPAALIVMLFCYLKLRPTLRGSRLLQLLGEYSLPLFLFNGIVRAPFLSLAQSPLSQLVFGLISAATSLAVSMCIQWLLGPVSASHGKQEPLATIARAEIAATIPLQ